MNTQEYRFIEPMDVLFLRGNKLFGDPGSFGESLVPPWPSVAAGALRSRMLADDGVDFSAFSNGEISHPLLGTPAKPGPFSVNGFHLARRQANGTLEILITPPADLSILATEGHRPSVQAVRAMRPTMMHDKLDSSAPLPKSPVLAESARNKPASGYWLNEAGWSQYIRGQIPQPKDFVSAAKLWSLEHRVGVGLESATRRAADGHLFSMQAIAMQPGVGFLVLVSGATPPREGALRLGGDGRAAIIHPVSVSMPEPDFVAISRSGRCRLILATPGIFAGGWKLPGMDQEGRFVLNGIRGRLTSSAVPRTEIVSGWDLAKREPKSARRAVPAGSVYWLEELEAEPNALRNLAEQGLSGALCQDNQRRVEGFNRFWLANWHE